MARRSRGMAPPLPFDAAIVAVRKLQEIYTNYSVHSTATLKDFTDWAFEPEVLDKLKWAFEHCEQPAYRSNAFSIDTFTKTGANVLLFCVGGKMGILAPVTSKTIRSGVPLPHALGDPCEQVLRINDGFATVIGVLKQFNIDKWTYGAALHYLPHVRALFSVTHPIHALAGGRSREPNNVGPLLPALRSAQSILTDALLMPTNGTYQTNDRTTVAVSLPTFSFWLI
jgi:hypothetical protein